MVLIIGRQMMVADRRPACRTMAGVAWQARHKMPLALSDGGTAIVTIGASAGQARVIHPHKIKGKRACMAAVAGRVGHDVLRLLADRQNAVVARRACGG